MNLSDLAVEYKQTAIVISAKLAELRLEKQCNNNFAINQRMRILSEMLTTVNTMSKICSCYYDKSVHNHTKYCVTGITKPGKSYGYREYIKYYQSGRDKETENEFGTAHKKRLEILKQALNVLSEKQKDVVMSIYYNGETLTEYANRTGVTVSAVSRTHSRALENIKTYFAKQTKPFSTEQINNNLLEQLNEAHKTVLEDVYINGLSITEHAKKRNISKSTASRNHYRALEKIETIYKKTIDILNNI